MRCGSLLDAGVTAANRADVHLSPWGLMPAVPSGTEHGLLHNI